MFWFISYKTEDGRKVCEQFYAVESLFEWLQQYRSKVGVYPTSLCVYKAECVFDGS